MEESEGNCINLTNATKYLFPGVRVGFLSNAKCHLKVLLRAGHSFISIEANLCMKYCLTSEDIQCVLACMIAF